jgi:hypothetical protein
VPQNGALGVSERAEQAKAEVVGHLHLQRQLSLYRIAALDAILQATKLKCCIERRLQASPGVNLACLTAIINSSLNATSPKRSPVSTCSRPPIYWELIFFVSFSLFATFTYISNSLRQGGPYDLGDNDDYFYYILTTGARRWW